MATVRQILGKINPMLYAKNGAELLAKYGTIDKINANDVEPQSLGEHNIVYDSSSEGLEPIYFWLVDFMENRGFKSEKLMDNFASSPGSGHFAELGQRATIMQSQGSKILGDVNTVLRSVLNLIYDLKEFRIRLEHYDSWKSKDKSVSEAAMLALKQIWLDKVDITKGNSSVKAMSFQGGFQTLLHAFLAAENEKDVDKMDLNDVVKRILKPRVQEFNIWVGQSEKELRKRYELEKTYLRSQVNSLKLYSRWAKPYLKAAQQLEMKDMSKDVALIKAFNTILLELSLLGVMKLNVKEESYNGVLPKDLQDMKFDRDYYTCVLVDLRFRGIPQRAGQQSHYVFGGKVDVKFSAYSLNSDELEMMRNELGKDDVDDVLKLIDGASSDSINQLQEEINFFLEEKDKEEEKKAKKESEDINPFFAITGYYNVSSDERKSMGGKPFKERLKQIFGFSKSEDKKEKPKKEKLKTIRPDNWIEKNVLREFTSKNAAEINFDTFDIYKKNHGMASFT